MNRLLQTLLAAALAAGLAGCGYFGSKDDYKSASGRSVQPLEVPPELTRPTIDDRYAIPDPKAQTSYSAYAQRPVPGASPVPGSPGTQVLPPVEGARLERQGDQRWLVVKGDPAAVWPIAREFWIESGFTLAREEPNTGILETDWYDDKSKIPQDAIRRTLERVMPNAYSSVRRDKYRTRLEKGSEYGTTEIFVSNRQVEEAWADSQQNRTVWMNKPADREAEAEMLQRLMVKMGSAQAKAAATATAVAAKGGAAVPDSKNAVLKGSELVVNDSFDRTWRRVGLALDRVGFTVEDRDRSKGVFFVRYIDPERDSAPAKKDDSWTEKLKFWKSSPKTQPQYRIHVSDAGSSMSQVQIQDAEGVADQSGTGKKILALLYDQLK